MKFRESWLEKRLSPNAGGEEDAQAEAWSETEGLKGFGGALGQGTRATSSLLLFVDFLDLVFLGS